MLNINNNPWLGLASYEYEDSYRFFGREKELERLKDCVSNNLITTIYGISGAGKTSLINAGMCPLIEKEGFLPVRIRLEHDSHRSYSEQIVKAVGDAVAKVNGEIETLELFENLDAIPEQERLWLFFYTSTFWSVTNHHLYPVVFVDQFEEIFTKNDNDEVIGSFFEGVSALQYDNPPATITRLLESMEHHSSLQVAQDFRVVLIMREDFLARLEDFAYDSPALRKNRVGIKRMNGNQALCVITEPQPGIVSRDVALNIIAKVAGREVKDSPAFLEQLSVDTSLLSLFCSEVYIKAAEQKHDSITRQLIDQFGENILASFYTNTMKLVPKETADYLESHLLTKSGFRNSVAMEDIEADGIRKADLDKLCARRLIRIETSEGTERVEFTHDVLCAIAKEHRDKAFEKTSRKQSNKRSVGFVFDILFPMVLLLPSLVMLYVQGSSSKILTDYYSHIDIPVSIGLMVLLLFNVFVLFPYRHTKDRNAIFHAISALLGNTLCGLWIIITIWEQEYYPPYSTFAIISLFVYFLLQFFNSFRFNTKRDFKGALSYTFRCKVYKDHPEMLDILQMALLGLILFVSFIVGLSMNVVCALILTPLCSLSAFGLLNGLLGQTIRFDKKTIFIFAFQSVLVVLLLASQFLHHHWVFMCLCLAVLLVLTIFYIKSDVVFVPISKQLRNIFLTWGVAFAIIPLLQLGYNPFRVREYHRAKNGLIKDHQVMRFLVIEDDQHKEGVRDRWNLVVPVEYDYVRRSSYINFSKEDLRGIHKLDHYDDSFTTNDVAFTVFQDSESTWYCSNHLDMHNEATSLIYRHLLNYAITNSDQMKSFIAKFKDILPPDRIRKVITRYNVEHNYTNPTQEYNELAYFTMFTGDFVKSETYARQSIESDSTNILAYTNLFDALFLQGKYDEAGKIFDTYRNDTVQTFLFEESVFQDFDELVLYRAIDASVKKELKTFVKNR